MSVYSSQLKDPRWNRIRKYILRRDDFKCTVCGSKKDLNVHHTYYYKEMYVEPWRYPTDSLQTVCEKCHFEFHSTCEVELRDAPKEGIPSKIYLDNPACVPNNKNKAKKKTRFFKPKSKNPNTLTKGQKRRRRIERNKKKLLDSISLNKCKEERMKAERLENRKAKNKNSTKIKVVLNRFDDSSPF